MGKLYSFFFSGVKYLSAFIWVQIWGLYSTGELSLWNSTSTALDFRENIWLFSSILYYFVV